MVCASAASTMLLHLDPPPPPHPRDVIWGGGGGSAALSLVRKYSDQFTTNWCNQLVIQYPCVCIDSVRIYRCDSCIFRCDHPTCLMRSLCFRFSRLQVPWRISTGLWITDWLTVVSMNILCSCYLMPVISFQSCVDPFSSSSFLFFFMNKLEFV